MLTVSALAFFELTVSLFASDYGTDISISQNAELTLAGSLYAPGSEMVIRKGTFSAQAAVLSRLEMEGESEIRITADGTAETNPLRGRSVLVN